MTERKRRPRLTGDERARIEHLRGVRGWSYERIAGDVGCSVGSVSWYCLLEGIEHPDPKRRRNNPPGPRVVMRNGHAVKRFTPEEDAVLLEMGARQCKPMEIARALGRKCNSVIGRLNTLARIESRTEEA